MTIDEIAEAMERFKAHGLAGDVEVWTTYVSDDNYDHPIHNLITDDGTEIREGL